MSDDFHRPTYTTDAAHDVHGAFNATQVRLYGIPGLSDETRGNLATMYSATGDAGSIIMKLSDGGVSDSLAAAIKKPFGILEQSNYSYVFINAIMRKYVILLGALSAEVRGKKDEQDDDALTCGIIFGYAYEGHTYDLPKPKIMMIPANPIPIPADDSGYDAKSQEGYKVWLVDKLDQCVDIDINQGFIEQLVLEANLPGKRSPTMYVGKMMLAHRSGRLTE